MAKQLQTTMVFNGKMAPSLRQAFKFTQSEAGKTANKMAKMSKLSNSLNSTVAKLGGAVATVLSVQKIFDTADAWATVRSRVGLVTDSVQQQQESLNALYATSQKTRQSYEATSDLYSKIAMNAEQLNIANSDALKLTETINKSLIVGGGGAAQNEAAILQFGQALASGKLQGDELRSLLENAPRLTKALADGLGVATGSLKEMGKEGLLTSDVIIKALESQSGVIDKEFSKMPVTIRGAFTYVENAFGKFIDNAGQKTNVFNKIAEGIIWVTDELFSSIERQANSPYLASIVDSAVEFGTYVIDNWGTIKPIIQGISVALVGLKTGLAVQGVIDGATTAWKAYKLANEGATVAQWALNAAMDANPIGLIVIAVAAAVAAGYYLWKNWDTVSAFLGRVWDKIKYGFATGVNFIVDKLNWLIEKMNLVPGVNIPLIPKMQVGSPAVKKYAAGGFANTASIFGEAGLEAAIPIKRKSPRSIALLNKTAQLLGVGGGSGQINLTYAPTIYGGNKEEIRQALNDDRQKFEDWAHEFFGEQRRVAFG